MAIAGGACSSIELSLDKNGKLVRGAIMMRQSSVCVADPAIAVMELRRGKTIYLRLVGSELVRVMRLLEDDDGRECIAREDIGD